MKKKLDWKKQMENAEVPKRDRKEYLRKERFLVGFTPPSAFTFFPEHPRNKKNTIKKLTQRIYLFSSTIKSISLSQIEIVRRTFFLNKKVFPTAIAFHFQKINLLKLH